jgi:two-component system response regulator HydG
LRDRPEDIPLLSQHFADQYAARTETTVCSVGRDAMNQMVNHSWPGNIRELKNAIERAALLTAGGTIQPEHLPPEIAAGSEPAATNDEDSSDESGPRIVLPIGITMAETEREMMRSTLAHTSGNKTQAAKILDISLKTMHNKVKKYQL